MQTLVEKIHVETFLNKAWFEIIDSIISNLDYFSSLLFKNEKKG